MTLPIASEGEDIVRNASGGGEPRGEGVFYEDLRYQFRQSIDAHAEEFSRYVLAQTDHGVADHGAVEGLVAILTAHGARFVDALLPRYEIAFRAAPDFKEILRDDWVGTLADYFEMASREYDCLRWLDGPEFFTAMAKIAQFQLEDRIDHGIRGIVIEPKPVPKWHERHPVAYAVGLVVLGALLAGLVDAVVKLVTGG